MLAIRFCARPLCYLLVLAIVNLSLPQGAALAAMLSTEAVVEHAAGARYDRDRIRAFLAREDVRAHLVANEIDPDEALRRVDTLTDREIALIARNMDELPAGGLSGLELAGLAGLIVTVAVIVFWVLLGAITGAGLMFRKDKKRAKKRRAKPAAEVQMERTSR